MEIFNQGYILMFLTLSLVGRKTLIASAECSEAERTRVVYSELPCNGSYEAKGKSASGFEIDKDYEMALSQGDKNWIKEQHEIAHAAATGGARVAQWLKSWGILAACLTGAVALIALSVTCIIFAVSEMRTNTEFRGDAKARLSAIEGSLRDLKVQAASSSPSKKTSQAIVKRSIKEAKEGGIPLPESLIQSAGAKFLEIAQTEPGAWEVVADLASYASDLAPWKATVMDKIQKNGFAGCFSNPPYDPGITRAPDGKTLSVHGPVRYRDCVLRLDDPKMAGISLPGGNIFENCLVKYSGGEILVPGIYKESIFEITPRRPPTRTGLLLAQSILDSPASTSIQF